MSAMDVIVTQDKEGNYSCTPFYVLFHCSMLKQNILERVVMTVNECVRQEVQMYKDYSGEVFFVDDEVHDYSYLFLQNTCTHLENDETYNGCIKNAGANNHQKVPAQEYLKSMKLHEGVNTVRFSTVGTNQIATAKIFLWGIGAKIVVTDIDGTITKSDTRGLFYSRFGMKWHHNHVTDCFKKVYDLGYKIVFITARSMTMEAQTRKYIAELGLPVGPLLLSPKTLVQAFASELISRDSKQDKMEHLSHIISLFPNCENPIVAGFGNNENDEWAYHKSGIPNSHIFIVNKKSEILCNSGRTSYEVVSSEICKFFQSLVQDLKVSS